MQAWIPDKWEETKSGCKLTTYIGPQLMHQLVNSDSLALDIFRFVISMNRELDFSPLIIPQIREIQWEDVREELSPWLDILKGRGMERPFYRLQINISLPFSGIRSA